jgi:putative flippase GtrA
MSARSQVTIVDMQAAFKQVATRVVAFVARDRGYGGKFARYGLVSGLSVVVSQAVIFAAVWGARSSGTTANLLGAAVAVPIQYALSRRWVWCQTGRDGVWRDAVAFCGLTVVGLVASSLSVHVADSIAKAHHAGGLTRAFVVMGASLCAYGLVWAVRFVVSERYLFGAARRRAVIVRKPLSGEVGIAPASGPAVPVAATAGE